MNRYILSAIVILLSVAIAETEQTKTEGRTLEMSEEYLAQREKAINTLFESRNTIVVDQFGGGDYTTIQEAIDNSGDGTTVQVNAGVYYENLNIDCQSIHLKGAGMDASIIQALGRPINIDYCGMTDIRISGFTFRTLNNDATSEMIRIYKIESEEAAITIEHCKFPIDSNERSIYLSAPSSQYSYANIIIRNNIFQEDDNNAIYVEDVGNSASRYDLFVYNNVFHNVGAWAIDYSNNYFPGAIEISNNVFYGDNGTNGSINLRQSSWNHWIRYNASTRDINYDYFPLENIDPMFFDASSGDYRIYNESVLIDSGAPDEIYNDLDGSRNNIGVYGGPYTWRSLGPLITNFQVTPDVLPQGESIRIQASGSAE